jgi:hypothetical protein
MRRLCIEHFPPARVFSEGAEHNTRGACAPQYCCANVDFNCHSDVVEEALANSSPNYYPTFIASLGGVEGESEKVLVNPWSRQRITKRPMQCGKWSVERNIYGVDERKRIIAVKPVDTCSD